MDEDTSAKAAAAARVAKEAASAKQQRARDKAAKAAAELAAAEAAAAQAEQTLKAAERRMQAERRVEAQKRQMQHLQQTARSKAATRKTRGPPAVGMGAGPRGPPAVGMAAGARGPPAVGAAASKGSASHMRAPRANPRNARSHRPRSGITPRERRSRVDEPTVYLTLTPRTQASSQMRNIVFAGQGIYAGATVDSARHGMGKFWFVEGSVYEGEWNMNQMHGHGKMVYPTGGMCAALLSPLLNHTATCVDGENTQFRCRQPSGLNPVMAALYIGEFENDVRHGSGTLTYPNDDVYSGGWAEDNKQGHGVFKWAIGASYEGDFSEGVMHGEGRYTFEDGCTYCGQYADGRRHGRGTFTYVDGSTETAEWQRGLQVPGSAVKAEATITTSTSPLSDMLNGARAQRANRPGRFQVSGDGAPGPGSQPANASPSVQWRDGKDTRSGRRSERPEKVPTDRYTERAATDEDLSRVTPDGPSLDTLREALHAAQEQRG